jgi:hypothetical protein
LPAPRPGPGSHAGGIVINCVPGCHQMRSNFALIQVRPPPPPHPFRVYSPESDDCVKFFDNRRMVHSGPAQSDESLRLLDNQDGALLSTCGRRTFRIATLELGYRSVLRNFFGRTRIRPGRLHFYQGLGYWPRIRAFLPGTCPERCGSGEYKTYIDKILVKKKVKQKLTGFS